MESTTRSRSREQRRASCLVLTRSVLTHTLSAHSHARCSHAQCSHAQSAACFLCSSNAGIGAAHFPAGASQSLLIPTQMRPRGQPDLDSSSWRLSLRVTLGFVKWTMRSNHHRGQVGDRTIKRVRKARAALFALCCSWSLGWNRFLIPKSSSKNSFI